MVRCLPTMWETWVRSLGQEDPLEEEMANHSSTFAWKIPWMEESGRLQSMGSQRVRHDGVTSLHFSHCGQKRFLERFNFFKFTKARFMAQEVIYPGDGSMCT